jgi:hypothetical protein
MQRLTLERVAIIIVFGLTLFYSTRPVTDPDTWWHIRSAEHTLTEGLIYTDPFSHTMAGEIWTNHGWGAQVLLYGVWELAGSFGLALYMAVFTVGGMYFVYRTSKGAPYVKAFMLLLGVTTAAVFWTARPQIASFFFAALLMYWLYSYKRQESDRLWWIPPMMALWGNMHGGFSIGFILMGGFIAGEIANNVFSLQREDVVSWGRLRKVILVAVVSVPALVINPYGLDILNVPFLTVGLEVLHDYIQEWLSPNFHKLSILPFLLTILTLFGVLGASKKSIDWTAFILLAGTGYMALNASRNISIFAIIAVPILSEHLDHVVKERGWLRRSGAIINRQQAILNAVILVVILGVFVMLGVKNLMPDSIRTAQINSLPVLAVEHLKENPPEGLMFNDYGYGGYLIFMLPEHPVYMDGRTDLYGDEMVTQYININRAGGEWEAQLEEDDVQWVIVSSESGLANSLRRTTGWTLDYEDDNTVIFTRDAVGVDVSN